MVSTEFEKSYVKRRDFYDFRSNFNLITRTKKKTTECNNFIIRSILTANFNL